MQCSNVANCLVSVCVCVCVLIICLSQDPDKVHISQVVDMFLTSLLIFTVSKSYFSLLEFICWED